MEQWKEYKIGDVCDTISETYKGAAAEVVLINTSDVLEGKCLNHIKSENKDLKGQFKKTFRKDDILYSEIRPANKRFAYVDFEPVDYIASTKLMVLRHNEKINPHYLFYILKSNTVIEQLQMLAESRSGTFPQITFSELANLPILLPSLSEQDKILSVLSSLDDKIELNRQINDNLEQQAQALFKSWFVDFEPFKDGEFVDSELGMIPKGWTIKTLDSLCDIVGGGTPSKAKAEYYCSNGIAWLTPKDLSISHSKYSYHGEMDITELGYSKSSAKIMPKGAVLFSSRAPIGYISIAANEMCTNQGFKSLVPKIAGTCFLYLYLKENTPLIESQASGSTFKEVSGSLMKSQTVIVPNNTQILDDFEESVYNIFELQKNIDLEILSLQTIRDSLLPRLMSGELKINDLNC